MTAIWRGSLEYLYEASRRSAQYSERHFQFLGLLSLVVPVAYIVDLYVGKPYFDTLAIRCFAFIFATPLIAYNTKAVRSLPHFHVYFVLLTAYVLPFTFGLMLALNAASAPDGSEIEMLWILQYFVALFLFIQLIHNGPLATLLWCASTMAAACALFFVDRINWDELNRVMVYPVSGYLTALFFGIITDRNVDYVNSEKLRAASAVGGNIAHELRTPLASIRSLARSLHKHSETLVNAYEAAKAAGIKTGELNAAQVTGLRSALEAIQQEVAYSNTVIDMLLVNTSDKDHIRSTKENFPIDAAIADSIARYPFNNSGELSLVSVSMQDRFSVSASRLIIVHVFFNLIKNGVFYAQKRPHGRLLVSVKREGQVGIVEFKDTGPGMSATTRRRVFDRFYTTTTAGQGAGIGLSFCKMVMESIGGEIQCESREGEYTTFRLVFPAASDADSEGLPA